MDLPTPTTLILDLRDRMARIETKLDGHHEAHLVIDKSLENIDKRLVSIETRQDEQAVSIAATNSQIAISKARLSTLAAAGSALIAALTFAADHLWDLIKVG